MKQKITKTILGGLIAIVAMFTFVPSFSIVNAQSSDNCTVDCAQSGLNAVGEAFPAGAKTAKTVPEIARLIINWALYLAAIIAVIFIIYGGFLYITSGGDTGQAGKGRTTLVNALIGLTIVVLSYLIVQIVYNFLVN